MEMSHVVRNSLPNEKVFERFLWHIMYFKRNCFLVKKVSQMVL